MHARYTCLTPFFRLGRFDCTSLNSPNFGEVVQSGLKFEIGRQFWLVQIPISAAYSNAQTDGTAKKSSAFQWDFPDFSTFFLGQPTTSNAPHSPPPRACSPLAHPNPWSSGQSLPRLADLKSSCGWNQNHAVNVDLVGGLNPSENMKVNWDDYSQYMGK